jgi:hypothetical protein
VRPKDQSLAQQLEAGLLAYDQERPLVGIRPPLARGVFLEQLVESVHRVKYVAVIRRRTLSERSADPNDDLFDPIKAAIVQQQKGEMDEAFWLVFLFVHFGKHARAGWRYIREVYGRLGDGARWDWANTSTDLLGFKAWLHEHRSALQPNDRPGGFGNHRKYESLDAYSPNGTGAVVESYVNWVGRTHQERMEQAHQQAGDDPRKAFDYLYHSMQVKRFGRTARFDYLTMIGKLGLAPLEPGSTYMKGSTGPVTGARLLFGGEKNAALSAVELDSWLLELDTKLGVGMQVLEDALCNWQKSPIKFKRFRG